MPDSWERHLERWTTASLIDAETAARIREYEGQGPDAGGLRWPIVIAVALGAMLLGAGVLLFVSAHWDEISPAARMSLVVLLVGMFHAGGAVAAGRFESMSVALHAIGTFALGAGIALTGQIFHLAVHWPAGIMMWALGALAAWGVLRHWAQAAIAAILIPCWLVGEWSVAMEDIRVGYFSPPVVGTFLLAVAYLTAIRSERDSALRIALGWIGGFAIIPSGAALFFADSHARPGWEYQLAGWTLALVLPSAVALILRGRAAVWNGAAMIWALGASLFLTRRDHVDYLPHYLWFALFAIGLVAWGVVERRTERINLGIAGFAILVLGFYFSNVMDKLGRSASLIGMGILFLAGGWLLEKTRRRLVAQVRSEA